MSATEYFRRNCWISTECDDRFVADVIRWMGDDHIVFETDFPHPDSKYPHATEHFLALATTLSPTTSKRKILWDNAVDLYRFPEAYLPTRFEEATGEAMGLRRPFEAVDYDGARRARTRRRPSTSRPTWLRAARGDRARAARAAARARARRA